MPFIEERKPPVSQETVSSARRGLPREYGYECVDEGQGRVLLVRVPRAKPDYNYELAVAALYVSLDDVRNLKHVLLVGDETLVRMDPIRLRDHVRDQIREDAEHARRFRASLEREYGWTVGESELNASHRVLTLRFPAAALADVTDDMVHHARAAVGGRFEETMRQVTHVLLVADGDYGRLGRRAFLDGVDPRLAKVLAQEHGTSANPLHLKYQTAGGTLR